MKTKLAPMPSDSSDDQRGHDIERAPRPDFLKGRSGFAGTVHGVLVAPVLRAFRLLATVQFVGYGQVLPAFMPGGAEQPRLDRGEIAADKGLVRAYLLAFAVIRLAPRSSGGNAGSAAQTPSCMDLPARRRSARVRQVDRRRHGFRRAACADAFRIPRDQSSAVVLQLARSSYSPSCRDFVADELADPRHYNRASHAGQCLRNLIVTRSGRFKPGHVPNSLTS